MKFKVGDKVRVLTEKGHFIPIGTVVTIEEIFYNYSSFRTNAYCLVSNCLRDQYLYLSQVEHIDKQLELFENM